jgi:YidC/Oxa1 family membrane protein insertase
MNETDKSADQNLWIAIALMVAVLGVWYGYIEPKVNPHKPVAAVATTNGTTTTNTTTAAGGTVSNGEPVDAKTALASADETPLGIATAKVASRGAALASYSFQGPISRVELVADASNGLFSTFGDLDFKRDPKASGLVYNATRPDGVKVSKEFVPGNGTVLPRMVIVATNPSRQPVVVSGWNLTLGPGLGTVESAMKDNAKETRVVTLAPQAKHIETRKPGQPVPAYSWIALENRYFLAALVPSPEHFEPATVGLGSLTLTAKPVTLAANGTFTWEIPYYLGAKGHAELEKYGLGLERSIDYGIFRDIGRPIFTALTYLHEHIGNWGWSIIALTLGLQLILSPLTLYSLKAAAAMRILQPEMAKLQAKYKDDPTRLNTEMMALYKKHGANPLSGCLPMLMQMPIFVALYNVLKASWELHGSTWFLWIHDLSAKDPFYVLPVVMGGLMFAQSKLNPPAGDPAQQQMMMFMPLIFTVMFAQASSGLVLYWLTNSLVSTLMQLALRNRLNPKN